MNNKKHFNNQKKQWPQLKNKIQIITNNKHTTYIICCIGADPVAESVPAGGDRAETAAFLVVEEQGTPD